ncbi:MAG: hypothetical protein V1701_05270 [Planctomycetota bacterium]
MSGAQKFVSSVGGGIRKTGRFVKATTDTTADLLELTLAAASLTGRLLGKLHLLKKGNKAKDYDTKPSNHQGHLRIKEYEEPVHPRQSIDEITNEKNDQYGLMDNKPVYTQAEAEQSLPSNPDETHGGCHGKSYEPGIAPDCETEIAADKNAIAKPDNDSLQEIISAILEAQKTELTSQEQPNNENAIEDITEETTNPYETDISAPSEAETSPEQTGWADGIDNNPSEVTDTETDSSDIDSGETGSGETGPSEGGDAE